MLTNKSFISLNKQILFFLGRTKKLRELSDVKITLNQDTQTTIPSSMAQTKIHSYTQLRSNLQNLGWQMMSFDKLCSLPEQTIKGIEIEIKKDKFNVDDSEFYQFRNEVLVDAGVQLNPYYSKINALIRNHHSDYDRIHPQKPVQHKYLHQIYLNDLKNDKVLNSLLTFFVNNLQFPDKLEAIVQPGLVKKLLTLRRQLMIQGIKFKRLVEIKQAKKEERKMRRAKQRAQSAQRQADQQQKQLLLNVENEQNSQKEEDEQVLDEAEVQVKLNNRIRQIMAEVQKYQNAVQVTEVIGYEYEFWVDVKHNRKKNGTQDDYILQQRQIDNPNNTLLMLTKYPKIKVKYIVRKRKSKDYCMHFCTKAELLVKINKQHLRRVKIQWNGPANKQTPQTSTDYKIIDYQLLMNGNPTTRPVFQF